MKRPSCAHCRQLGSCDRRCLLIAFQTGDLYHARHDCSGLSCLARRAPRAAARSMPNRGMQTAFFEKTIAFVAHGRLADSGSSLPFNAPESDTLIKHQAVGGETLMPNNCAAASSNSRASRGCHAGILTVVLRLRIMMSALRPKADIMSAGINIC